MSAGMLRVFGGDVSGIAGLEVADTASNAHVIVAPVGSAAFVAARKAGKIAVADVADITKAASVAYYQRVLMSVLSSIPATAAKGKWDSLDGLRAKLDLPNPAQLIRADVAQDVTQSSGPSLGRAGVQGRISLHILDAGTLPDRDSVLGGQYQHLILGAPYTGAKDVQISRVVREFQQQHPARRIALTFFSSRAQPSEEQKIEMIRDGIDQLNHQTHTEMITPLHSVQSLRDAITKSDVNVSALLG